MSRTWISYSSRLWLVAGWNCPVTMNPSDLFYPLLLIALKLACSISINVRIAVLLLFVLHFCGFFMLKTTQQKQHLKLLQVHKITQRPRHIEEASPSVSPHPSCVLQLSSTNKLGGSHARFIFYTRVIRFEVPPAPATHNFLRLLPSFGFFFHPRLFPTFLCYFWGDDKEAGTIFICSLWIRRRDGILKRTFLIGFHQADRQFKIRTKEADKATVWFFFPHKVCLLDKLSLRERRTAVIFPTAWWLRSVQQLANGICSFVQQVFAPWKDFGWQQQISAKTVALTFWRGINTECNVIHTWHCNSPHWINAFGGSPKS